MAMIQCSECGDSVSDKAGSCPNCGAPVRASGDNTQTIEETSKTWKSHQLFGGLATVVGFIGAMTLGGGLSSGGGAAAMIFGAIGFVGIFWFLGARMMAWWHHG
jgi:hypothetical protein